MKHSPASSLAAALLLPVAGIWIPFLHLYLLNGANLTLPLRVHLPQLAMLSLLAAAAAAALQFAAPRRRRPAVTAAVLLGGAALWAEGILLIGGFGFLQGGRIDWGAHRLLLAGEVLVAAALVLLFVYRRRQVAANAPGIVLLLTAAALPGLYPALKADRARTRTPVEHTFTREGTLQLSARRNVLLFIVDTFQSDFFADIVTGDPRWQQALEGFTYFPDAVSGFPKTYVSVPELLTGRSFDNSRPYAAYLREAYLGRSAPRVLRQHGFDVRYDAFTWQPYLPHPDVADNLSGIGSADGRRWMQRREFRLLADLVLLRLAPLPLKPWVHNDGRFRLQPGAADHDAAAEQALTDRQRVHSRGTGNPDLEFLDRALAHLAADGSRPAFRVYHLKGNHFPLELDKDLNPLGRQPRSPGAFRAQSEAMLVLLTKVFARLREIGAWDNSLVLVVGDHGAGEFHELPMLPAAAQQLGLGVGPLAEGTPYLRGLVRGGTPVVMAKRAGATGPLTISAAPVALGDIPATILAELDLGPAAGGRSLFAAPGGTPRVRHHWFYRFAGWGQDYIVPLTEYRIDGFAWDPASWSATGRDMNAPAIADFDGTLVVMGDGGNLDDFPHGGWTAPLGQGRFMTGGEATVTLPAPPDAQPLALEVRLKRDYAPPRPVPLEAWVDGVRVARWGVSREGRALWRVLVPERERSAAPTAEVRFVFPEAEDDDPLFVEIRLAHRQAVSAYALGQVIDFRAGGNARRWQGQGWEPAEDWGAWTGGCQATLHLAPGAAPDLDLELEATFAGAVFGPGPPLQAEVTANGVVVARWTLADGGRRREKVALPGNLVRGGRRLDLGFHVPAPRSPRDAGVSDDGRLLGLGLVQLTVGEPGP